MLRFNCSLILTEVAFQQAFQSLTVSSLIARLCCNIKGFKGVEWSTPLFTPLSVL